MSFWDYLTGGNVTDPAAIAGAGDPVLAQIGTGADYEGQLAVAGAVAEAEKVKGAPLSDSEFNAIADQYPSADVSTQRAHLGLKQAAHDAGDFLTHLPGKILGAVPWWLWLAGGVTLLVLLAPYAKFVPVPRRSK